MKLEFEPYKPRTHSRFWCQLCDNEVVDSNDNSTGHFFLATGHSYDHEKKEYDGEYEMVMFARCHKCLEKSK